MLTHILPVQADDDDDSSGGEAGALWVASTPCHSHAHVSVEFHQQRCADCKSLFLPVLNVVHNKMCRLKNASYHIKFFSTFCARTSD